MYLITYECPHCGRRISLPEQESVLLDAAPGLLDAAKATLKYMIVLTEMYPASFQASYHRKLLNDAVARAEAPT